MSEWLLKDSRPAQKVLHPSTCCAIEAVNALASAHLDPARILDLGCGSGLLALLSAALWPEARIIASDLSEQACEDARVNVATYGLESRIEIIRSEGFAHARLKESAPFDLILANLLARTLFETLEPLSRHLAEDGMAVLSGILVWRLEELLPALDAVGLCVTDTLAIQEWRALVIARKRSQACLC